MLQKENKSELMEVDFRGLPLSELRAWGGLLRKGYQGKTHWSLEGPKTPKMLSVLSEQVRGLPDFRWPPHLPRVLKLNSLEWM